MSGHKWVQAYCARCREVYRWKGVPFERLRDALCPSCSDQLRRVGPVEKRRLARRDLERTSGRPRFDARSSS